MSLALHPSIFPAFLLFCAISDSSSFPPPCPLLSMLPHLCPLMGPQANNANKVTQIVVHLFRTVLSGEKQAMHVTGYLKA